MFLACGEGLIMSVPKRRRGRDLQLKLSFYDRCISIPSSKKFQTPIILADLLGNESFLERVQKVIVSDL